MKFSRLALAICCAPSLVLAEQSLPRFDEQLKLPETVVTASRLAEEISDTYSSISVFTRADIERLQANTVVDLLRRTPGVQIIQNGGRGSTVGVFIRGTKTAQTLVLLDGQRINDSNMGGAPLNTLSVDQIERVEILRGPRSAIYGSDAIGGVIQIFTRRAEGQGLKPRVRVAYGSHNTWEQSAGISGGDSDTRFNLSMNHEKSDGFNRSPYKTGLDADKDGFDNRSVALNLNHRFSENHEVGVNIQHIESQYDYDNFPDPRYTPPTYAPHDEVRNTFYSAYLNSQLSERWSTRLEAGLSEGEAEGFTDYPWSSQTKRESLNWLNTLSVAEQHRIQVGLDWYEDSIDNSADYEKNRYNAAGFLQHSFDGDYFGTEVGVRHDKNQQYGEHTSFNSALKVPVGSYNQLLVSYGEGFRAPSMAELYYPYMSNPKLVPETSKTYELRWLNSALSGVVIEASLYRTDLKDAIASDQFWIPQNIAKARLDGFELSANAEILGWQHALGMNLLRAKDRETGLDLQNRARRTLSWDIDRQFGQFGVGASWLAYSQAYSDAANNTRIPGYGLLGVRASWQVLPELEIAGKLDNLLDKTYYTTTNGNLPYQEDGLNAQIAFTWTPSL